ncbi:MAG: metal-dependent hydrolase [Chloroflexi bacterium]|nr:MAG: metal-dependent hydrolase [Chloroflexota bacterium]
MLNSEQQKQLQTIAQLPQNLAKLVQGLSEDQLQTKSLDGEWSVQQIVHHLADSHMNSFIRLKLILTEDNPPLKSYQEPLWAKTADVSDVPISASLHVLNGLHQRWVKLFASLNAAELSRTGFHSELNRTLTPVDLLEIYAEHCDAHLDQIRRVLRNLD